MFDRSPEQNPLEARNWLKNTGNPAALAGNRFGYTKVALEFVERLYQLGAVEVVVIPLFLDDLKRIEEQGGPYSDNLVVKLPPNLSQRIELIRMWDEELDKGLFDPASPEQIRKWAEEENDTLNFWWD